MKKIVLVLLSLTITSCGFFGEKEFWVQAAYLQSQMHEIEMTTCEASANLLFMNIRDNFGRPWSDRADQICSSVKPGYKFAGDAKCDNKRRLYIFCRK